MPSVFNTIYNRVMPPEGLRVTTVDGVVWTHTHSAIHNPKPKDQELRELRDRAAAAPVIPPRTMAQYTAALEASADEFNAFIAAVEENEAAIEKGKKALANVGVAPPKPKALQRMVGSIKKGAESAFGGLILSRPIENERDFSKLNMPASRNEPKRSTLDKLRHRRDYGNAAQLLGEGHLRSRELQPSVQTAKYLLDQADEDMEVVRALIISKARVDFLARDGAGHRRLDNLVAAVREWDHINQLRQDLQVAEAAVRRAGGRAVAAPNLVQALADAEQAIVAPAPAAPLTYHDVIARRYAGNLAALKNQLGGNLTDIEVNRHLPSLSNRVREATSPQNAMRAAQQRYDSAQQALNQHVDNINRRLARPGPANPPWLPQMRADAATLQAEVDAAAVAINDLNDAIANNTPVAADEDQLIEQILIEFGEPLTITNDTRALLDLRNKAERNRWEARGFNADAKNE